MAPALDTLTAVVTRTREVGFLRLLLFFPLVGAALNGLFGRAIQARLGRRAVHAIALSAMVAAAAVALVGLFTLVRDPERRTLLDGVFPMLDVGSLRVGFDLTLDPLSSMMTLIITIVGALIHVYATAYMHDEPSAWRFFASLNLFVFAMLLLVLADNFVLLFFGWEGVGLASWLLIGFWYREPKNATAARKAFVVNRVGDAGFLLGFLLLFWGAGAAGVSVDGARPFATVRPEAPAASSDVDRRFILGDAQVELGPTASFRALHDQLAITDGAGHHPLVSGGALPLSTGGKPFTATLRGFASLRVLGAPLLFVACLLLFVGATGKSAQIPLYVWLPDAMAGPTPVSALIHAATMVTAGVYLLARLGFLFALSPGALTVVACVGAATALFAATIGLLQHDIKKVLAYSTVSQLGFMFLGVGSGASWSGAFHLLTHACFKAALFLGAGSIIHALHQYAHETHCDPQDLRRMGGLGPLLPHTRRTYLVACWAIAGFPWAAGFFSKDEILFRAFGSGVLLVPGWILWLASVVASACTSFYIFRSYYLAFYARPTTDAQRALVHESPRAMTWVLWALAGLCLLVGPLLGLPSLFTGRPPLLARWLAPAIAPAAPLTVEGNGLEAALMLVSVAVAFAGFFAARALYRDLARTEALLARLRARAGALYRLVYERYRVDELYDALFVRPFVEWSAALALFDRSAVDAVVDGFGRAARAFAAASGAVDRFVVDGAVNLVADGILAAGRRARRLQTGHIGHYLFAITAGVVVIVVIAYFV